MLLEKKGVKDEKMDNKNMKDFLLVAGQGGPTEKYFLSVSFLNLNILYFRKGVYPSHVNIGLRVTPDLVFICPLFVQSKKQ